MKQTKQNKTKSLYYLYINRPVLPNENCYVRHEIVYNST